MTTVKKILIFLIGLSLGLTTAFASEFNNDTIAIPTDTLNFDSISEGAIECDCENDPCFMFVEQMPEFPGGDAALKNYIKQNLRYPNFEVDQCFHGRVWLTFIVEKDGTISNIRVLGSPAKEFSDEAIRLVKSMPKWTPGKKDNTIVKVQFFLPITFRIEE